MLKIRKIQREERRIGGWMIVENLYIIILGNGGYDVVLLQKYNDLKISLFLYYCSTLFIARVVIILFAVLCFLLFIQVVTEFVQG